MISRSCKQTLLTGIPENPIQQLIELNICLRNLVHAGKFSDSLRLFQKIHSSNGLKPDHYTLSTALSACANLRDTGIGSQLHAHSIRSGLKSFRHVTNTLLSLYAKCHDLVLVKRVFDEIKEPDVYSHTTLLSACMKTGEVDCALNVFKKMPQRNVAVWNAIITGSAENGREELAFDLFRKMHFLSVGGDNYTFASVLSLCCSLEEFDFGRQVHCLVVKTGFLGRASVINSLLSMYFGCNSIGDAYSVFEEVGCEVGDEITYNSVIGGLVSMERHEEALSMFKDMQNVGLKPTELTFVSVMGACLYSRIAIQVHGQAIKIGFEDCTPVNNAAISMYTNCGDLNTARLIFERLEEKDIVSWNSIIASYAQENSGNDAICALCQMQNNGIEPDEFTIGSLLASTEVLEVVETIQAFVIKKALILKVEVSNSLLSAFSKYGEIDKASKLFLDNPSKNLISWNSLISGFLLNGLPENGLHQFSKLLLLGFKPNHYTLSVVLSICASIYDLMHGKALHTYILKFGYFSHTLLGNALIALYAKCGALHLSSRVFNNMIEKDIVSWNSIISAYAQHGEGEEAIKWFEAMQNYCGPDKATFTAVLSACSHSGLVSDGIQVFNLMVNGYGVAPEMDHFSCIVDLLGRAGFLDIANSVIKNRGIDIDPSVWWTLLSCCAAHGNLELGSIVAGFLLENGNDDSSVYVLLSNLYANAGKWEESAKLRDLMRRDGVMKQPGSSWIGS